MQTSLQRYRRRRHLQSALENDVLQSLCIELFDTIVAINQCSIYESFDFIT